MKIQLGTKYIDPDGNEYEPDEIVDIDEAIATALITYAQAKRVSE